MKKKGISLIVLIITIIVVIILATIIIMSFNKNNPIKKAQEAKFKSEVSQFKEELLMTHANNLAENKRYKSESVNVEVGNYNLMKTYIPSITEDYAKILGIENGKLVYGVSNDGDEDEDEKNWVTEIGIQTIVKVPDDWAEYIDRIVDENVPIPKGFTYKEGTKATGVVIEDGSHNEFVWIPSTESEYVKDFNFPSSYNNISSSNISEETFLSGLDETLDVKKYGGFYIGRYEATTPDGTELTKTDTIKKPTCMKGKTVWTDIIRANAKASAESMYTGEDSSVKSGLLTGKAWDRTCHFIEDSVSSLTDSRTYGNYFNSIAPANTGTYISNKKQLAGSNDNWKTKNIYDLAGNVWEYTYEINLMYSSSYFTRGGGFDYDGATFSASWRSCFNEYSSYFDIGFRVRLYIKTN